MPSILQQIVAHKQLEIAVAKEQTPAIVLERALTDLLPPRDFAGALIKPPGVQVIAEIKRASPSAGLLSTATDVTSLARTYALYGAICISVLTDQKFFHGSLLDLTCAREVVSVPVLRKDFILDPYQLLQARVAGADAVLLITEILDDVQLLSLLKETRRLGMEALVECFESDNLARAVACGALLIGINNRNLHTFHTSLEHTFALAKQVPSDRCLVSESGITTRADVAHLASVGVKAVLVGETLMRASNVPAKLSELCGVGA